MSCYNLDDSWNGLNLKIARDLRDKINNERHEELIKDCIEMEIDYKDLSDEEMKQKIKTECYENLSEEEVAILNKEESLTDEEIEKFNKVLNF